METKEFFEILCQRFGRHTEDHETWEPFLLELTSPIVATGMPAVVMTALSYLPEIDDGVRGFYLNTIPTNPENAVRDRYVGTEPDDCWYIDRGRAALLTLGDLLKTTPQYDLLTDLTIGGLAKPPDFPKIRQANACSIVRYQSYALERYFAEHVLQREGWVKLNITTDHRYVLHPSREGVKGVLGLIARDEWQFKGFFSNCYLVAESSFAGDLIGPHGSTIQLLEELWRKRPLLVVGNHEWESLLGRVENLRCWSEGHSQNGLLRWIRLTRVRRGARGSCFQLSCTAQKTLRCSMCPLLINGSIDLH